MVISLITLISPILGILMITLNIIKSWNKEIDKGKIKKYIFPLAIIFGIFGYSMRFFTENDLTRYFSQLTKYSNQSLNHIILSDTEALYTRDVLFYFVSKTGLDYILPFIVGFITYFIVFYILFDMIKNSELNFTGYEVFMLILLCAGFTPAYSVITNIRCVFAYVIMSFAIYRNTIKKKMDIFTLFMYIIPLGLHSSAIILLLIRILSVIFKKLSKLTIIIAIMLPTIIDFAHNYVNNINLGFVGSLLKNAINKAYFYLYWNEGGWATQVENSISNYFTKITGTIMICYIIYILLFSKKIKKGRENSSNNNYLNLPMINYLYYVSIFALGCLSIKTGAFWRFNAVVMMFSPVILIQIFNYNIKLKNNIGYLYFFIFLVFLANMVFQIRNINFIDTFLNFIKTNGLEIIYYLLKGLLNL